MPIPSPKKSEKQKDFVSRCMSDKVMLKEFEGNDQRYAVCINKWEKANEKQNSTAVEIEIPAKVKLAKANNESATPQESILMNMLQMQQQYRIFHWQTQSYSEHKAFGKIYKTLDENIDSFVETFMGKFGRIITSPEFDLEMLNYKNNSTCLTITDEYISFLTGLNSVLKPEDSDLLNIRDTILADLNQLKYLLSLQ